MDNRFVIKDAGVDLVSVADTPAGAEYFGVIIDAIRNDKQVDYARADLVEAVQVTRAPVKALKSAEPTTPRKKIRRRRRMKKTAMDIEPVPAAPIAIAQPLADLKPASNTQSIINGNEITLTVGEPVFIAWSTLNESARPVFDDIRESMGVVQEIRRKQGVRRSVLVKWDSQADAQWMHPDELSDTCEYCIEQREPATKENAS